MEKTAYRIIPLKTFLADKYLQFKRLDKKGKEIWCFVPDERYAYVIGECLTQETCPESLPFGGESNFKHSFYDQESFNLIPFSKDYPDIEAYFNRIQKKRKEYVEDQEKKKNDQTIIYL
jgi:hypothetical protein